MQEEERNINEDVAELHNDELDYHHYYSRPPLSKGQKIAVAVLAFFSLLIVIAWALQFKRSISAPLNNQSAITKQSVETQSSGLDAVKDSDGDGLTDLDEMNNYKTSPYLEDSDSDGFSDKIELDSGKDPNCPTGVDCSGSAIIENSGDDVSSNAQSTVNSGQNSNIASTSNTGGAIKQPTLSVPAMTDNAADLQKVLTGEIDAQTLRKTLIEAGMDKATLDKITDEALMASYQETLKK